MPFQTVVYDADLSLLQDGDFIQRHIGSQFVFEAVNADELAVQLFFVLVELHETLRPLGLELLHKVAQTEGGLQVALGYFLVAEGYKRIGLEIPGGLVGVPIDF